VSAREPVLVSAGAGSGKTFRIVQRLVERVRGGTPVERVAAVTFTEAAASELQDRLRAALLAEGFTAEASRVDGASVCTIHRFALTLLQRYPLAAGVPPEARVLDEAQAAALRRAALAELTHEAGDAGLQALLDGLFGAGLGLSERSWGDAGTPLDRLYAMVRDLIEKCRSVGMDAPRVRAEGVLASQRLLAAMGPGTDESALDDALRDALAAARAQLVARPEAPFKKDEAFYEALRAVLTARDGHLYDHALALAGAELSKPLTALFGPLVRLSDRVAWEHPELRRRVARGVTGAYALAADVLTRYADEKARLGALDFEDMQRMALDLLAGRGPLGAAYAELVAATVPFVVVDEFQDTSPLQFRLFEALRAAGAEVHYVGDLKQGIYGFRTADATLFAALLQRARARGDTPESLDRSRRSRPELVRFANAMFRPLLEGHDIEFEALTADNAYTRGACPKDAPSVDVVLGRDRVRAGLDRLAELIAAGSPVLDRETGLARPLRWDDCAVLAYTHDTLRRWSEALRARGIASVLAARGLHDTLEVRLATHWFRMIASPRDTAASAAVLLSELYGLSQRAVTQLSLARRLGSPKQALDLAAREPATLALTDFERRALARCHDDLTACRKAFRQLPIYEAVERALERVELADRLAMRLDVAGSEQVRANLAALVAVACRLDAALDGASGATLENYLLALDRDARANPWQPAPEARGVRLVTLHASKGMEYPVVLLDVFAQRLQARLPRVEVVRPDDASVLLGDGALDACGVQLVPDVGVAAWRERLRAVFDGERRLGAEWARLLYVAVTRARDHLVLAWPDETRNTPTLRSLVLAHVDAPPAEPGERAWLGERVTVALPITAATPPASPSRAPDAAQAAAWRALADDVSPEREPPREIDEVAPRLARVSPSELCQVADCPEVPRLVRFSRGELHEMARSTGAVIAVRDVPDARAARRLLGTAVPSSRLGKLVHAAVERAKLMPDAPSDGDLALAHDVLRAAGEAERADDIAALIVDTLACLRAVAGALGAREEPASEVPFVIDLDGTALHGIVDLIVRGPDGLHVIDLKTHLMERRDLARWAAYYRPQLDAYGLAVERLAREPVAGRHIVVPSAGALVTLTDTFVADHAAVSLASYASLLARETPGPAQDCAKCGWNELCRVGRAALRGR
jgi:ATP-dependent exoDNAse (exonuclease V) beta subunit